MSSAWKDRLRSAVTHNALLKVISIIIAFLLWAFLMLEKKSEIALSVPIRVENTPEELVMVQPPPDDLRVVLRGSRTQLSAISERINPYRIDLSGANAGENAFDIIPDKIDLPRGLQIVHVSPSQFTLRLAPVIERRLPVHVRFRGSLPAGYRMTSYTVDPETVTIEGARNELESLRFIETEPIDLDTIRGNSQFEVQLSLSRLHIVSVTTQQVRVLLDVEEIQTTRTFKNVPVQIPEGYRARGRDRISVTVAGPQHLLQEMSRDDLRATLTPPARPGRARLEIAVETPPRVSVDSLSPGTLEVLPK